jgi:hypothetical protein
MLSLAWRGNPGGFDHFPKFWILLQGFIFTRGQIRAIKKIFEGVAAQDAMHHHAQLMPLKVNTVIAQAKPLQGLARAFELAKVMRIALEHLLRQPAKLSQDVKLQFSGHFGQFGRAGRIEDDLKLHDPTLEFKVQSSKFKLST